MLHLYLQMRFRPAFEKWEAGCVNIPLAVYAWATSTACLAAQGVPRQSPVHGRWRSRDILSLAPFRLLVFAGCCIHASPTLALYIYTTLLHQKGILQLSQNYIKNNSFYSISKYFKVDLGKHGLITSPAGVSAISQQQIAPDPPFIIIERAGKINNLQALLPG